MKPDPRKEGFRLPLYCPRGQSDCRALAQIITADHASFICCGENDGTAIPQDVYTFCVRNHMADYILHADARDLAHMGGVLGWASAVIAPVDPRNGGE